MATADAAATGGGAAAAADVVTKSTLRWAAPCVGWLCGRRVVCGRVGRLGGWDGWEGGTAGMLGGKGGYCLPPRRR